MWIKFYMPMYYGIYTRAKGIFHKLTFIGTIFVPNIIIGLYAGNVLNFEKLGVAVVAFVAMYCIYEVGYLTNDTYTIRFEANPTIRLNIKEQEHVERWVLTIIASRYAVVAFIVYIINIYSKYNIEGFIVCLCALDILYKIYNSFRGGYNVVFISFVILLKYLSVSVLFVVELSAIVKLSTIIMLNVVFIRTIFFGIRDLKHLCGPPKVNIDKFRIKYYIVVLIVQFFMHRYIDGIFIAGICWSTYLLLNSIAVYVVLSNKSKFGNEILYRRMKK